MPLGDCHIISLESKLDARGALTVVEGLRHVPFQIARIYYLHGTMPGISRGAHAHRELRQLMIAVSGSFSVKLDDGGETKCFRLDSPSEGLFICPMIWRDLFDFSKGAVCLVLASAAFDEADYFRDYRQYLDSLRP